MTTRGGSGSSCPGGLGTLDDCFDACERDDAEGTIAECENSCITRCSRRRKFIRGDKAESCPGSPGTLDDCVFACMGEDNDVGTQDKCENECEDVCNRR